MVFGDHPGVRLCIVDLNQVGGRTSAPASHHKQELMWHTRAGHAVGRVGGALIVPVEVTEQAQCFHDYRLSCLTLLDISVGFHLQEKNVINMKVV